MLPFFDISYTTEVLFAAVRITLWFVLLFGFIAPLFLDHTRALPPIEKLIYSWIGLGGVIIVSVFVLDVLHIYDFISFVLTLLLIPLIRNMWKSDKGPVQFIQDFELKAIFTHVLFIEGFDRKARATWKNRIIRKVKGTRFSITENVVVACIALAGGMIRMYPAMIHAAPFSRNWYFQLNRVKNIRLQDYFSGDAVPKGMHSIVSVFSMLTQVSPEMILHILGALSSFFLCIIIYWAVRDITKNEHPAAPLFAMALYALTPMLLMPVSLDLQIEANSLDLALCFAIPTITIFVRNLRARYKSPWFYVLSGFVATGMTNLFVAFIILLPLMFAGLLSLPRRRYFRSLGKLVAYLMTMSLVILAPIIIYNTVHGIGQYQYLLERMYDIRISSFYPGLILPLDTLSTVYLGIAGFLLIFYLGEYLLSRFQVVRDELIFIIIFITVALFYSPYINSLSVGIDVDQLAGFYSVLIAFLGGVVFSSLLRWTTALFKLHQGASRKTGYGLLVGGFALFIFLQGGISVSRQLPETLPNGFYQSYYSIINNYLPYSYATVAPKIERVNAKNRHYFMDYQYFLDQYGKIDSLYHQQLAGADMVKKPPKVPPASIFLFMEKPPYEEIQKGILFNASSVMQDMHRWLASYRAMPGRTVKVYYEDKKAVVYQIINHAGESRIGNVLWHVYPEKKEKHE